MCLPRDRLQERHVVGLGGERFLETSWAPLEDGLGGTHWFKVKGQEDCQRRRPTSLWPIKESGRSDPKWGTRDVWAIGLYPEVSGHWQSRPPWTL